MGSYKHESAESSKVELREEEHETKECFKDVKPPVKAKRGRLY